MSWLNRPLMGADSETSGVDPETARIVTFCIGMAGPNGWTAKNWLFRQDEPIPAEATAIHGISTEYANQHGTDPKANIERILDDLYKGWELGLPAVLYNAVYDFTVLDREARRHNLGGLEVRGPVLDGLVIDKATDRYRKGSRKLADVCAHYGITLTADEAHGAEPDARAACRLVWKQARAHQLVGGKTLADLHAWQADAYHEQRTSFADYLDRKGNHDEALAMRADTSWPLKPHTLQEVAA